MGESISNLMIDLLELHFAEYEQSLIELIWVEYGCIFLDIAFSFKTLLTLKDWGGGQVDSISQFFGRHLCVSL